jgi:YfiH family protein
MTVEWIPAEWPSTVSGVIAGTTLRSGGISSGPYASLNLGDHVGDDPAAVRRNREFAREVCGLPAEPAWLSQVHGTRVVEANAMPDADRADGAVTDHAGVVCAVLTADCLPVVLTARDGSRVGVAHAGWRGLCDGILEATVSAMRVPATQLLAWLGPAISQSAFEVGGEVRERFIEADPEAAGCFAANDRGRWQADLYGLARLRLERLGVSAIGGGGRCTFTEAGDFFSYRRDGPCGRMATFVFRT